MTPPAAAARRSAQGSTGAGARRSAVGHPRRVSGPSRPSGSARAGAAAAAVALPAPGVALPGRRSAPARRRARPNARPVAPSRGLALGALAALDGVSSSALLDRVMRGRLWIGLLACALVGVVAMQLVVLKLNTGIGTTLEREAALERDNAQLSVENSTFSGENRIGPLAAASGMTLAPAGSVHFLAAGPAYISHAVSALTGTVQAPTGQSATTVTTTPSSESGERAESGESAESAESSEASSQSSAPTSSESEEAASSSEESAATSTTAEAPAEGTQTNAASSTSGSGATSASESPQAVSGPGGGTEAG